MGQTSHCGIECVCFDLGGVVVRICRSFEEAVLAAGIPLRPLPQDDALAKERHSLVVRHQRGEVGAASFHHLLSGAVLGVYSANEIASIHAAILQGEYPGMAGTIQAIASAGLATACLSNTNDDHWPALVALPALRSMHHRHASHLWGLVKPELAIFRRFERERGVAGRAILYFDDLAENIEAALAVGWDAVLIDHAGDPAGQVRATLADRGIALSTAVS